MTERAIHDMTAVRLGRMGKRVADTSSYSLWNTLECFEIAIEVCLADMAAFRAKRRIVTKELQARMANAGMLETGRKGCPVFKNDDIRAAMSRCDGSVERAARIVGMSQKGLRKRLREMKGSD